LKNIFLSIVILLGLLLGVLLIVPQFAIHYWKLIVLGVFLFYPFIIYISYFRFLVGLKLIKINSENFLEQVSNLKFKNNLSEFKILKSRRFSHSVMAIRLWGWPTIIVIGAQLIRQLDFQERDIILRRVGNDLGRYQVFMKTLLVAQLYVLSRPNSIIYESLLAISKITGWKFVQRLAEVQVILVLSFVRVFLPNTAHDSHVNLSPKEENFAYGLAVWDKIKTDALDKNSDFNDVVLHSLTSIISY